MAMFRTTPEHAALDQREADIITDLLEHPIVAAGQPGYAAREGRRMAAAKAFARIDAERVVLLTKAKSL